MDGRLRDVMTVVSGRGAHVLLLDMVTRLLVRALVILFFLKKVMQEVVQVKALLV
jgi:hypothetical protein